MPNVLSARHLSRIGGGLLFAASSNVPWATLLARTFDIDVKSCARCGGGSLTPSPRHEHYDGYIHYGKLTPETRPDETILSAEDEIIAEGPEGARLRQSKAFAMFRARIEGKERAVLGARALRR